MGSFPIAAVEAADYVATGSCTDGSAGVGWIAGRFRQVVMVCIEALGRNSGLVDMRKDLQVRLWHSFDQQYLHTD